MADWYLHPLFMKKAEIAVLIQNKIENTEDWKRQVTKGDGHLKVQFIFEILHAPQF